MSSPEKIPRTSEYPVWLAVPHEARDALRETAGRLENGQQAVGWDKEASLWFARPGCDLERVTDWLPDSSRRAGGGDAESEFLDALTQAGLVVQGMPVMDGARHRVSTVEDKNGKQSGVYRGFLDRRPGGWFINYHRAETAKDVTKWSATGGESDPVNRLHIKAAARQAQDDAARARAETYARQTLAAQQLYDRLPAADPTHPYLVRKGITPTPDLRETRNGALVVPFFNASGAFKTLQYIPPEGEKFLFKDAPKQGHFLVVGGPLKAGEPVLYAEGYATARSLNLGTGHPVVMTIDAGNMVAVAKVLHEQYPQSQHLFLADFDHAKAENKGLLMATAAAEAVGGQVLYPAFNDDEKARGLTDFNDLHLSRGLDELRTQVAPQLVTATQDMTMSIDQTPTADLKSAVVNESPEQAKSIILLDAMTGKVWTGQGFKGTDISEAQAFTPAEGLKAALELEHSHRDALNRASVEIRHYLPVLQESIRVIDTDAAKSWPNLSVAFEKLGVEMTREAYNSLRDEVMTSNRLASDPNGPVAPKASDQHVELLKDLPAPSVVITPAVRATLEKEWTALQSDFRDRQVSMGREFKEDLRQALKSEQAELKQQVVHESQDQSFGKRIAVAAGMLGYGETQTQIANLNRAIKQLDKPEREGDLVGTLAGRQTALENNSESRLKHGLASGLAFGELGKDRALWVSEQATLRMGPDGLLPPLPVAKADMGEFDTERAKRVDLIVQQAKSNPWEASDQAVMLMFRNKIDVGAIESNRFTPADLQASSAIDTRAQIFESFAAQSGGPAVVAANEPAALREWARMDTHDAAQIQHGVLRVYAAETLTENAQAVPIYAQEVELPKAQSTLPADSVQPAPAPVSEATLAVGTADVPAQQAAPMIEPEKPQPAALPEALPVENRQSAPAPVAEASLVVGTADVPVQQAAPVIEPEKPQPAALPEALPVENQQSAPVPVAEAPPAVGTADVPVQQPASLIEPEKPEPAALPEAVPVQGQQPALAPVMESEPFLPEDLQKSLLRRPAMAGEQPAEGAAVDAIWIGAPRPRGTEEEPQASNIDKDALLARLSWEKQGESAVLYKLDGEPAFVDHGNRLEMAKGAGQSDEKVIAALLTAAQYYRGRIELTGSDEFKAKAIDLIAQHQINVEMKNPAQQAALDDARKALNLAPVVPDAVVGDTPAPFDNRPHQPEAQASQAPQAAQPQTVPAQSVAPELVTQPAPLMVQPQYQPLDVADLNQGAPKPAGQPVTEGVQIERQSAAPGPSNEPGQQQAQASPKISPAIHQPFQAAKDGVQGKILASGQAPFRFEDNNAESTYIKLRTKTGVQTFWGKELAGLLRDTRVQPGKMVTLQWLGNEPVTIKVPRKDKEGVTLGFEDKKTHRNQWALTVAGNPTVRTGQDEGVKLGAYDAVRFAVVQEAVIAKLGIEVPMPSRPKDGLYWMTPNGEGSAKAGDELTAPRPPIDPKNTAGEPVISSWTQQGNLDMYLVRGDGPYLQGIARQENEYRHVLVSLPGSSDAPPMVFNAVTPEGLQPIGTGNGINRSGGQPVARENIAFKLEGDSAVRIGKLDAPASVPPDLHVRLGFDERWKEENVLPKSAPTAAPSARPSDPRPA